MRCSIDLLLIYTYITPKIPLLNLYYKKRYASPGIKRLIYNLINFCRKKQRLCVYVLRFKNI